MIRFSKLTSNSLKVLGGGLASLLIALPATAQVNGNQSISQIAESSNSFDVLTSLIKHAGFFGAFDGTNGKEFTIFAPTDDAFGRLPKGTIEALYKPENRDTLYDILAYHMIGGSVTSDQLSSGSVGSKNGLPLQINLGQQVTVNNATVRLADITASNGVIHAIDTVLIPQR